MSNGARQHGWRAIIAAAIADGDTAEASISARDLAALLDLPADRRQAVVDKRVADPRLVNLLPGDLQKLRESLGSKSVPKVDLIKSAADRRAARAVVLREYVAGYEKTLRTTAQQALTRSFFGIYIDPAAAASAAIDDLISRPSSEVKKGFSSFSYGRCRWWVREKYMINALTAIYAAAPTADLLHAVRAELSALQLNGDMT